MHKRGYTIGSHTASHRWLNSLLVDEQKNEIKKVLSVLESICGDLDNWIMCYPFEGYNEDTLSILKVNKYEFTLTTKVGSTDLSIQIKYAL